MKTNSINLNEIYSRIFEIQKKLKKKQILILLLGEMALGIFSFIFLLICLMLIAVNREPLHIHCIISGSIGILSVTQSILLYREGNLKAKKFQKKITILHLELQDHISKVDKEICLIKSNNLDTLENKVVSALHIYSFNQ